MQIDILSGLRQTARYFSFLFIISVLSVSCEKNINPSIKEENNEFNGELNSLVATGTPYSWAKLMIDSVTPANNIYVNNRDSITWAGWGGFSTYRCETDCSGLLTGLLKQSYGYTSSYFKTWTGLFNPYAVTYYNEIKAKDHFSIITPVTNIVRGDIIAVKYPVSADNTGHIMVVADPPILRTSTNPLITGTRQYEIPVMDCSSSGHGSTDTRYISSGVWNDGIGKGIFRVYVNSKGAIVGYTWSTYSTSVYYSQSERQLIVGRLIP
jgi:hypothetical protein